MDESNSPCPDGWIFNKFLNRCYKHVKGNNQTCDIWSIEKYCQKIGGHAISIHSLAENLYVSSKSLFLFSP
uniref:Uncharacterized protein n=1 Tax=Acrobeloides nanus TaxID=290746 RepID=A0A914EEW1_9BILA